MVIKKTKMLNPLQNKKVYIMDDDSQKKYSNVDLGDKSSSKLMGLISVIGEIVVCVIKIFTGLLFAYAGSYLTLKGIQGDVGKWIFEGWGIKSQMANASTGIVLIVAGVIIITTSGIKIHEVQKGRKRQ